MGAAKEHMIEKQQEDFEEELAKILGISTQELIDLQYNILAPCADEDESNFFYIVKFSSDSPHELLSKISRIEDDYVVYLNPWELEDDNDYDEINVAMSQHIIS